MARANDQILCGYLANLIDDDLVTRVKLAIVDGLPSGQVDSAVAKAVYLTPPRTLQGRLTALGTSYSKGIRVRKPRIMI